MFSVNYRFNVPFGEKSPFNFIEQRERKKMSEKSFRQIDDDERGADFSNCNTWVLSHPKGACPAVLMVWTRVQETKEIFGLRCSTMNARMPITQKVIQVLFIIISSYGIINHTPYSQLILVFLAKACFMVGH